MASQPGTLPAPSATAWVGRAHANATQQRRVGALTARPLSPQRPTRLPVTGLRPSCTGPTRLPRDRKRPLCSWPRSAVLRRGRGASSPDRPAWAPPALRRWHTGVVTRLVRTAPVLTPHHLPNETRSAGGTATRWPDAPCSDCPWVRERGAQLATMAAALPTHEQKQGTLYGQLQAGRRLGGGSPSPEGGRPSPVS